MKPTRPSALAVVAVIFAVLAWLLLRLIYQRLPPLPWTGVPALLLAAAAEGLIGRDLRARIAGGGAGGRRGGGGGGKAGRAAVRVADGRAGQGQFAGGRDGGRAYGGFRHLPERIPDRRGAAAGRAHRGPYARRRRHARLRRA